MKFLERKMEKQIMPSGQTTPATLLEMAVNQGADLDKLERLMDLNDRWNIDQSKKDYNAALAKFQSSIGHIAKTRDAHNSKYADIDDIAKAIRPILEENGLSYTFSEDQSEKGLQVTCTVRHISGHSESNSLSAPNDTSGGKNQIQAIASTVTYLRRYTLTGALGITTGSDDHDGGRPSVTVEDLLAYMLVLRENFPSVAAVKECLATGDYASAKEAWRELDEATQSLLWKAPSKGGVFETDERGKMKSNEWHNA